MVKIEIGENLASYLRSDECTCPAVIIMVILMIGLSAIAWLI